MSCSWERAPVDIVIASTISGAETVYYEWAERSRNLLLDIPRGLKTIWIRFPEPMIDISRDKALLTAITNGAKWLFFFDTDLLLPRDAMIKLMRHNLPIVGGLYVRRHNPPFNEMLRFSGPGGQLRPIQDNEYNMGDLVQSDAIATGCMLLQTDVIEKIKPFQITIDGQPTRPRYFLWTEFNLPVGHSEDFAFCVRARQCGIPIYCDTSIQCGHMGVVKFYPSGNGQMMIKFPGEQ